MRLRDAIIWLICICFAAGLFIVAGMRLDYINSKRTEMNLISNRPLENAPPSLAFATVAMGAFRGLVVDVLWMRADRLKEQGQFFDAKQLAEWITTLQPRFASVWAFQAWNMAYNISVAIPASQPEQRWRWVKNGYELLRDKGIVLNPGAIALYRELAWIFQHKIGGVSDDAHKYYKLQLALAMESLLGPADDEYFEALAAAPSDWQEIIADGNVAKLVESLKSADDAFSDQEQFVSNYLALRGNPARFNPQAFACLDDFRGSPALKKFDIFARAYQLRKVWKLDPVLMVELNKTYGPVDWNDPNRHLPLDWRHPDTHAIYWAVKGLQVAGDSEQRTANSVQRSAFNVDEANTDRIVAHSLQNLFRNGKIFIYRVPQISGQRQAASGELPADNTQYAIRDTRYEIFLRPDLRMFAPYNQAILAILEKYKEIGRKGTYKSLQNGHRNMLKNALFSFYQAGHIRQAQEIYKQLRELYPRDEFKVPLVAFVRKRLREELESIGINNAKEIIIMMLRESYFRYAMRDDDEAFAREKMAKEAYDHYHSIYSDEERINLPDLKLLRYLALLDFLNDHQYPRALRGALLSRIEIERPELASQLKKQEEKMLKRANQQMETER